MFYIDKFIDILENTLFKTL